MTPRDSHNVLPSHHQLESLATRPSNPAKLLFSPGFSRCLRCGTHFSRMLLPNLIGLSIRTREKNTRVWLLEVLSAEACIDHTTYIRISKDMSIHLKDIWWIIHHGKPKFLQKVSQSHPCTTNLDCCYKAH